MTNLNKFQVRIFRSMEIPAHLSSRISIAAKHASEFASCKNDKNLNSGEKHVAFLEWLEATSLAEWARVSISGYPISITAHSIGLAVMVGPVLILDLRLLGWFKTIPYESLSRILAVAWIGFAINFLSGAVLFSMQAVSYMTNYPFLVKLALVLLGAVSAAQQQSVIARDAKTWETTGVPKSVTAVAVISIVFWVAAIITGRLIAYVSELQPVLIILGILVVLGVLLYGQRLRAAQVPA